ncbi:MAG: hypothetical protein K0S32_2895 [Bacteroidetes bacterium]|nr:hypothetical protein [Bacteroidota bacterium]
MLSGVDIKSELSKLRSKTRKEEDQVLREVDRILHESTFNKKNVLDNLKHYSQTFELVNEDEVIERI